MFDDEDDWMLDPEWAADPSVHVTLPEAKNEKQGVAAENAWIQTQFPNHQKLRQRCRNNESGRRIDEIILKNPDGKEVSVFFDITDWFGK